jgi:hypothetical protein
MGPSGHCPFCGRNREKGANACPLTFLQLAHSHRCGLISNDHPARLRDVCFQGVTILGVASASCAVRPACCLPAVCMQVPLTGTPRAQPDRRYQESPERRRAMHPVSWRCRLRRRQERRLTGRSAARPTTAVMLQSATARSDRAATGARGRLTCRGPVGARSGPCARHEPGACAGLTCMSKDPPPSMPRRLSAPQRGGTPRPTVLRRFRNLGCLIQTHRQVP